MKSCPIGSKLADCVAQYKPNLWWKDDRDPARTVAVRAISILFHSLGGEMKSCPIGSKLDIHQNSQSRMSLGLDIF